MLKHLNVLKKIIDKKTRRILKTEKEMENYFNEPGLRLYFYISIRHISLRNKVMNNIFRIWTCLFVSLCVVLRRFKHFYSVKSRWSVHLTGFFKITYQ